MYKIKIDPKVNKFLEKSETQLSERIKNKLKSIKEEPFIYLEHLEGQDFYKLRIGNYRALIDVDKKRKIIFVRHIDHRKRIYKKL